MIKPENYLVEIITDRKAISKTTEPAHAWGEDAISHVIKGATPMQFTVSIDGGKSPAFSIRILEDGKLIFTNYRGGGYDMAVPQNLCLEPGRPWDKEE